MITDDRTFRRPCGRSGRVEQELKTLGAGRYGAEASWQAHGGIIVVRSFEDVPALVDRIAPEHLELAVDEPDALSDKIKNAGAIFLGRHTPEAVGDYIAGPSHVLPTSGTARFSSGLSVMDFLKRTSLIGCTADGLRSIGASAVAMAEAEDLKAHARSVSIRLNLG